MLITVLKSDDEGLAIDSLQILGPQGGVTGRMA